MEAMTASETQMHTILQLAAAGASAADIAAAVGLPRATVEAVIISPLAVALRNLRTESVNGNTAQGTEVS